MKKKKVVIRYHQKLHKFNRLLKDLKQSIKNNRFGRELDDLLKEHPPQLKCPSFPKPPEWESSFSDIPFKQLRLIFPEVEWENFCNSWRLDFLSLLLNRPLPFVKKAIGVEWRDSINWDKSMGMNIHVLGYISKNMLRDCLEKAHNIIMESCDYKKESAAGAPIDSKTQAQYLLIYKEFKHDTEELPKERRKRAKQTIQDLGRKYKKSQHTIKSIVYPRLIKKAHPYNVFYLNSSTSTRSNCVKKTTDCIHVPMTNIEKSEYIAFVLQTSKDMQKIKNN